MPICRGAGDKRIAFGLIDTIDRPLLAVFCLPRPAATDPMRLVETKLPYFLSKAPALWELGPGCLQMRNESVNAPHGFGSVNDAVTV